MNVPLRRLSLFVLICILATGAGAVPSGASPSILQLKPAYQIYVAYGPASRFDPLPSGVERLGQWRGGTLLGGPPSAVEELAARGIELILLDGHPLAGVRKARPVIPTTPPPPRAVSPTIAAIVLAMSPAEMTMNLQRLQDFRTRYSYSDSCRAAAFYLRDRFQALGLQTVLDPFAYNGSTINNVIAEKTGGSRPDEIYIICGHYDSISNQPWTNAPGADDNGSGTAAVLEAARVLASIEFEATIRFIAFGGEEQGLIGSRHYVEQHVIPQGDDVRGVINLDMIAYVHPSFPEWDANWFADAPVSGNLAELVIQCVEEYTTCTPHLMLDPDPFYGSDHYWFADYGYPAVFDIDAQLWNAPDWNPYYHSINDLLMTLNVPYATEMARGAVAALATLAVPQAVVGIPELVAPPGTLPLAVGPNPFRFGVVFDVGPEHAVVRLTHASGRLVSEFTGSGRVLWQGRDAAGRPVPAGVYFYTVRVRDKEAGGRLVRVR